MIGLLVGVVGLVLLLVAFVLDEFTKISKDSIPFNLLNIVGAIALGFYAFTLGSIPFIVLEGVWGGVAAYKLVLLLRKHK